MCVEKEKGVFFFFLPDDGSVLVAAAALASSEVSRRYREMALTDGAVDLSHKPSLINLFNAHHILQLINGISQGGHSFYLSRISQEKMP